MYWHQHQKGGVLGGQDRFTVHDGLSIVFDLRCTIPLAARILWSQHPERLTRWSGTHKRIQRSPVTSELVRPENPSKAWIWAPLRPEKSLPPRSTEGKWSSSVAKVFLMHVHGSHIWVHTLCSRISSLAAPCTMWLENFVLFIVVLQTEQTSFWIR